MNIEGVTDDTIIKQYQESLGTIAGIDALEIDAENGKFNQDSDQHHSVHAFLRHYNRNR